MRPLPCLVLAAGLVAAASAAAHDTWFALHDGRLVPGTGQRFPLQETLIAARHALRAECDGVPQPRPADGEAALAITPPPGARGCWLQLAPFEVTLAPALVETYLREVNPPPAVRAAWAAMQREGRPWRERYVKHARIALGGADPAPAGLGLELVLESAAPFTLRAWRDGRPLPGFAVELCSERGALGVWRRTDADGRVTLPALPAGRWLARAIELLPSDERPGTWDSRFATLAFEVQNGSSWSSNARSANQAAASAAISSEPPTSTPRR